MYHISSAWLYHNKHKHGKIVFGISDKVGGLDHKDRNNLEIKIETEEDGDVNPKQIHEFL